uniref:Zgc:109913 n=1 Tax=Mastacembelus armatus TaxID=205130 RepID=A0A3Q3LU92_9TELE
MSRWRRSVTELAARRRQQVECERAQEALTRVTSCFQQLVASLGSSADCSFLRDQMDEARALAHRICSGLSQHLVCLLSDCDSAPSGAEDRQVLERLWVLFLSVMENFLSDLRKASNLIGQFPLTQRCDRRSLVNTGCIDGVVGVAARAAAVQVPWLTLKEELSPDLTNHITELEEMLSEMQLKVSHNQRGKIWCQNQNRNRSDSTRLFTCVLLFHLNMSLSCRFLWHSGRLRQPSQHGLKLAVSQVSRRRAWRT